MTEKKPKLKVERRLVAKVINVQPPRPADDLFNPFAEAKAAEKTATPPPSSSYPLPPPTTSYQPTAPAKDFTRVYNSVTRDAIPAGLFKGNSKKVYDVLYLRTRGARVPARTTKIKHAELKELAKVSHNTLRDHLRHLETVGLVVRKMELGDNDGATYEVFVPEELPPPTTPYHHLLPPTASTQELGGPSSQNLVGGGGGQLPEESTISVEPKTSFKTNTERTDDEAFAGLLAAERELTGRNGPTEKWAELVELLVTELKIAAGRTEGVSSVPAFLTEHLRRRLWKKEKRQVEEEGKAVDSRQSGAAKVDASKCPDCFGASMWYPEGFEKGVARCGHDKLRDGKENAGGDTA